MSQLIMNYNGENFSKDILESGNLTLVDFWAPWCGPCVAMSSILEEIAQIFANKVKIVKINVEENQQIAHEFNIRSIPTLILFKDGKSLETKIGSLSIKDLETFINKYL